jgi:hypothetical protein
LIAALPWPTGWNVRIDAFEFGRLTIDGAIYDFDVVIEGATIRRRKKGPSKALRGALDHTPLTAAEAIPWSGKQLWIGTGAYGRLPVSDDLRRQARRRGVTLLIEPTPALAKRINAGLPAGTNLIIHVTC